MLLRLVKYSWTNNWIFVWFFKHKLIAFRCSFLTFLGRNMLKLTFKDNWNSLGIFVPGANTPNFSLSSLTKIIVKGKKQLYCPSRDSNGETQTQRKKLLMTFSCVFRFLNQKPIYTRKSLQKLMSFRHLFGVFCIFVISIEFWRQTFLESRVQVQLNTLLRKPKWTRFRVSLGFRV